MAQSDDDRPLTDDPGAKERRGFAWRDEVWGDEPEERDATEVVTAFEDNIELERRWHDHPAIAPIKIVARFIQRSGKRIAVTIVGSAVLLAGIAMLVLPGPGILVIIGGLAILATEYVWAQRMLTKAKEKANQAKNAVLGKKKKDDDVAPEP